jgi:hypothetical protein
MATGEKQTLSAKVDREYADAIDELQERRDYDYRSDAVRDVVRAGLREERGPFPGRARQLALDGAYHLTLVAVTVIVIGFATGLLPAARATAIALALETVAVAPLAAVETVRALTGQSALGDALEVRR